MKIIKKVTIIFLGCLSPIGVVTGNTEPVSANGLSGFQALLIIVLAGAFGGFVDGLSTQKPYALSFKVKVQILGSLVIYLLVPQRVSRYSP